jgi:HlyD family secretion protein
MQRRIVLTLLSAAILVAIVFGFIPEPVPVDVATVKRDTLRVAVEEEGRTRVIDRFVVSAPVAGYIRRIEHQVGDTVNQRMVLAELEPMRSDVLDPRSRAQAKAQVAAAESGLKAAQENVRAAQADADYAESEFRRLSKLCKEGCVTEEQLDRAEAQARRSKATLRSSVFAAEIAQYELEAAQTTLKHSAAEQNGEVIESVEIRSPVNGRILQLHRESEGVIPAGQALLEIGDPAALEVVVDVLSSDAVKIQPGSRVLFERWGGDAVLEGVVRLIEPTGFTKVSALGVEEQRVWIIVDISSDAALWQRLGDGYRVEASFVLWEGEDVLQLPASSLFRHQGEWAAFVMKEGRAERRTLEIGQRNGLVAEIKEGVVSGEQVILNPDESIEEGVRVAAR